MPSVRFVQPIGTARALVVGALLIAAPVHAQTNRLQVVGKDALPVSFVSVAVNGGAWQVTNDKGILTLGGAKKQILTIDVRRIGFDPVTARLDFPDTASTLTVTLTSHAQTLDVVNVKARDANRSLEINGFYERWLERQKGMGTGQFIGPAEIESRNPDRVSNLLRGRNGFELQKVGFNQLVAVNKFLGCALAIMIDGHRVCPDGGCTGREKGRRIQAVDIDQNISVSDVAAIEIYTRGGTMTTSAPVPMSDSGCGVILIWTGSRR